MDVEGVIAIFWEGKGRDLGVVVKWDSKLGSISHFKKEVINNYSESQAIESRQRVKITKKTSR